MAMTAPMAERRARADRLVSVGQRRMLRLKMLSFFLVEMRAEQALSEAGERP